MSSAALSFDLCIDPNVRFVSTVRRFIEAALERLLPDPDTVFRVVVTTQELLENAGKYCAAGSVQLRFSARLEGEQALINLSLANQATASDIVRLSERIAAIGAASDPFTHYQELVQARGHSGAQPGLGLARIAAEADMALGLEVQGNTVEIIASTKSHRP